MNARLPNRFAIPKMRPTAPLWASFRAPGARHGQLHLLNQLRQSGNTFAIDNAGRLTVANNSLLDYETLATNSSHSPAQFELFVNIMDNLQPLFNETNRRVLVAVTNVNEPPVIAGFVSSNALPDLGYLGPWGIGGTAVIRSVSGRLGHFGGILYRRRKRSPVNRAAVLVLPPPGTGLGALLASDPDFHTVLSFSIIAGNSNSMFAIDKDSGILTVAGDPTGAIQNQYITLPW